MRLIHIVAGFSALISGTIALYALKGGKAHRKSGMIFVIAMLLMSTSAVFLAIVNSKPDSLVAGLLTFYLILTSLFSVKRFSKIPGYLSFSSFVIGLIAVFFGLKFGGVATFSANGRTDDKSVASLIFGVVALFCLFGDLRNFFSKEIQAKRMLVRHLWRMCLAMFLAAASFFLGQAKFFPAQIRSIPLLATPVLLVAVITIYWVLRTKFKKTGLQN